MAEREALGALTAEVSNVQAEVAALRAAISQILGAQQAQTALLEALLASVTPLGDGEGDGITEALSRIADGLDAQSDALDGMRIGIEAIPGAVAAAVEASR